MLTLQNIGSFLFVKPPIETRIKNAGIRKSNSGEFYGHYQRLLSEQVNSEKENGLIKVIIGIRRCERLFLLFELYR